MGTPDFAVPSLKALSAAGHDVALAVCQPDKPVGRKQILTPCAVKEAANELGIPVYQPKSLRNEEAVDRLGGIGADVFVVAAYGKILPPEVLAIPRLGCVNVHGSLLPAYRGASPIQSAVLAGEKKTGITTMLMNEGLDTGDILLNIETDIGPEETSGELFDRLAELAPPLLLETLTGLEKGGITPFPQDDAKASYTKLISKADAEIDWDRSARELHDHIRGMAPWPIAFTFTGEKRLQVLSSALTDKKTSSIPGTVIPGAGRFFVACGEGSVLELLCVKPEGSKQMSAEDYLKGHDTDVLGH